MISYVKLRYVMAVSHYVSEKQKMLVWMVLVGSFICGETS